MTTEHLICPVIGPWPGGGMSGPSVDPAFSSSPQERAEHSAQVPLGPLANPGSVLSRLPATLSTRTPLATIQAATSDGPVNHQSPGRLDVRGRQRPRASSAPLGPSGSPNQTVASSRGRWPGSARGSRRPAAPRPRTSRQTRGEDRPRSGSPRASNRRWRFSAPGPPASRLGRTRMPTLTTRSSTAQT